MIVSAIQAFGNYTSAFPGLTAPAWDVLALPGLKPSDTDLPRSQQNSNTPIKRRTLHLKNLSRVIDLFVKACRQLD